MDGIMQMIFNVAGFVLNVVISLQEDEEHGQHFMDKESLLQDS
jgi:hypothetical protein